MLVPSDWIKCLVWSSAPFRAINWFSITMFAWCEMVNVGELEYLDVALLLELFGSLTFHPCRPFEAFGKCFLRAVKM